MTEAPVTQVDKDVFRDIFHVDPIEGCPHSELTLQKLARHRIAGQAELVEVLAEAIELIEDWSCNEETEVVRFRQVLAAHQPRPHSKRSA